ncbi:MAG: MBL fold metallo-hydrolase [Eubacteriales bacterium]|nr:MBL fold metallo-hydrolase [Eubacteriales bacterium]
METEAAFRIHPYGKRSWYIDESFTRMFLLEGDEHALLIDTGLGTGDLRQAVSKLTDKPIILANTHGDHDHCRNNHAFAQAYMHPSDYCMYDKLGQLPCRLMPMWEGQTIDLGGRVLEAILIPGHTPGSLAYLDVTNRELYGGDSVQNGTIFLFGSGRSLETYLASMRKLWNRRERFDRVYASHGPLRLEVDFIQQLISYADDILADRAAYEMTVAHATEVRAYRRGLLTLLCPNTYCSVWPEFRG